MTPRSGCCLATSSTLLACWRSCATCAAHQAAAQQQPWANRFFKTPADAAKLNAAYAASCAATPAQASRSVAGVAAQSFTAATATALPGAGSGTSRSALRGGAPSLLQRTLQRGTRCWRRNAARGCARLRSALRRSTQPPTPISARCFF